MSTPARTRPDRRNRFRHAQAIPARGPEGALEKRNLRRRNPILDVVPAPNQLTYREVWRLAEAGGSRGKPGKTAKTGSETPESPRIHRKK
jgi:hypothetical protein